MIGSGIGKFLNDVGTLVESRKTGDVVDISNQSSKQGIRIVLQLLCSFYTVFTLVFPFPLLHCRNR